MSVEQLPIFPDIPVSLWDGRRFLGRKQTMGSGGMTAAVRTAVFQLCVAGNPVTTDSTGHPQSRVRSAFRALARERMIKVGKKPCRNPHGYRLVARLHKRLRHLMKGRMLELDAVRRPGRQSYFAVPSEDFEGWWGPATTPEKAIEVMLAERVDEEPISSCLVAIGYRVTQRRYPDLFDGSESISEYAYQVERPYVRVDISRGLFQRRSQTAATTTSIGAPAPVEAEGGR